MPALHPLMADILRGHGLPQRKLVHEHESDPRDETEAGILVGDLVECTDCPDVVSVDDACEYKGKFYCIGCFRALEVLCPDPYCLGGDTWLGGVKGKCSKCNGTGTYRPGTEVPADENAADAAREMP